jgi:hypothetical protein
MSMKNSNDTIGNRTSDLPACSTVPQPTTPQRTAPYLKLYKNFGILFSTENFVSIFISTLLQTRLPLHLCRSVAHTFVIDKLKQLHRSNNKYPICNLVFIVFPVVRNNVKYHYWFNPFSRMQRGGNFYILNRKIIKIYIKIQLLPHNKHKTFHCKSIQLVLIGKIIAVCSKNQMKHSVKNVKFWCYMCFKVLLVHRRSMSKTMHNITRSLFNLSHENIYVEVFAIKYDPTDS